MLSGLFMYLIFLILGFSSGAFKKLPNQCKTKGIVDSLEQKNVVHKEMPTRTAVVSYVVEGKTYKVETPYQSSFFRQGKKLVVCYDGQDPQKSFVRAGIIIYILMAGSIIAGTLFIVSGIIELLI